MWGAIVLLALSSLSHVLPEQEANKSDSLLLLRVKLVHRGDIATGMVKASVLLAPKVFIVLQALTTIAVSRVPRVLFRRTKGCIQLPSA